MWDYLGDPTCRCFGAMPACDRWTDTGPYRASIALWGEKAVKTFQEYIYCMTYMHSVLYAADTCVYR